MNRFEQVKAFVKDHRTEILVASGVLAGVVIGAVGIHGIENKELYKARKAFKSFNLGHKDEVLVGKTLEILIPDNLSGKSQEKAREIADGIICYYRTGESSK